MPAGAIDADGNVTAFGAFEEMFTLMVYGPPRPGPKISVEVFALAFNGLRVRMMTGELTDEEAYLIASGRLTVMGREGLEGEERVTPEEARRVWALLESLDDELRVEETGGLETLDDEDDASASTDGASDDDAASAPPASREETD